ncbi:HNH endonuclease [Brachybacterium alimentarium]|uniref:HNH endonuclease n=1 Tax=Brachybacterium alimentarium TaxID=47845 RepID=UPI000DF2F319|nr:HNH endonuclease [Brachybacterium alimentarium]RCS71641.1 HNH endonuclease [Brachybacterium alimentarium]
MSTPPSPADGPDGPSQEVAALHASGPAAVAELLGDAGFLLGSIAVEPEVMFDAESRAREEYVDLLHKAQEMRGILDALEARTLVALSEATRLERVREAQAQVGPEHSAMPSLEQLHQRADARSRRDVSHMTRRSPSAAGRTVASARRLVTSMPHLLTAMATGKAAAASIYAAADAAAVLDAAQRSQVDDALHARLPDLDGSGTRRWRQAVALAVHGLDPEGETVRHRRSRTQRHVTFTPASHGMATISAYMPAIDARLMHKRISLEAERRQAGGEKGPHGALMADILRDAVLTRDASGGSAPLVTMDLGVIITDRALFHPGSGDVAHLEGYGPVPAEAVREQLRAITATPGPSQRDTFGADGPDVRAVVRRLYTHPTTGELVSMDSRARAFPPAMGRFLTWRDTSCRGPFCNASVRHHDHITPFSRGGPTSLDNGQDLCAHCNQKEDDALAVERVGDPERPGHRVAWTSGSGTTRVTAPPPLIGQTPPAEPDDPDGFAVAGPDEFSGASTDEGTQASSDEGTQAGADDEAPARTAEAEKASVREVGTQESGKRETDQRDTNRREGEGPEPDGSVPSPP